MCMHENTNYHQVISGKRTEGSTANARQGGLVQRYV